MSFPIKLSDGTIIHLSPTEEAEELLDQLAMEHPEASIEDLMDMLCQMKN